MFMYAHVALSMPDAIIGRLVARGVPPRSFRKAAECIDGKKCLPPARLPPDSYCRLTA